MTEEIIILRTRLINLFDPTLIDILCRDGYKKTGRKFTISSHGSKGYLSHITISCEGSQKEGNHIFREEVFNKNGSIKKHNINIFYSEQYGVRLSTGNDEPRDIAK